MGDNTEVMNGITRLPGVSYPVLTPNLRVRALASCQPRGGRVAVVLCVGSLSPWLGCGRVCLPRASSQH